ncbi:MAG TPA: phosphotransferase [Acidimicrobiales bacterium]|nr:phosphotransferase [Acidimicrobiales bacterium]
MGTGPVSELLGRASARVTVQPDDGKSSATFERLTVDGGRYFLKRLSPATDWIMRVTGDTTHRPYLVWRAGIMDRAPACIDHTVVAMELQGEGPDTELLMLMRDVGPCLVPEGDAPVPVAHHEGFLDHLAQLSAAFWGFADTVGGLTTMTERLRFFDRPNVARELAVDDPPGTIVAADAGWRLLPERSPLLADMARHVQEEPHALVHAMAATPATFLHGDWKMGNLGRHPGGRTILLDWAYPGSGPACWDLCWYLALNRARLPETKEASIDRFRAALERHGVATGGWFDTQLDLCLIGMMVTFGWEKALGDDDELRWWERRVRASLERQGLDLVDRVS